MYLSSGAYESLVDFKFGYSMALKQLGESDEELDHFQQSFDAFIKRKYDHPLDASGWWRVLRKHITDDRTEIEVFFDELYEFRVSNPTLKQ